MLAFVLAGYGFAPAQRKKHKPAPLSRMERIRQSIHIPEGDTILPRLINKVETYTFTIDRSTFILNRRFDISPVERELPVIEEELDRFKTRLERKGRPMNLRSLNSAGILLKETADRLANYKSSLSDYGAELTQSNEAVKKILADPQLGVPVSDSVLQGQINDVVSEGRELDSMQRRTLMKINLWRNRVSVSVFQANDMISDLQYQSIGLKMAMWGQQEPPLFQASPAVYHQAFPAVAASSLLLSGKIIYVYLGGKLYPFTLSIFAFIFITLWCLLNMLRIKKKRRPAEALSSVHFLRRSVIVGSLMAFCIYSPLFLGNSAMPYLHANELLRLICLWFLLWPFLPGKSKVGWVALSLLWIYYSLDNLLMDTSYGERWGLFIAGIFLCFICIMLLISRKKFFVKIAESPAAKPLLIFALTLAILSVIFNLTGRLSLAKIFGVSAIQCLMLGIALKVFFTMVLEAIYLQSEAYHETRFAEFINFGELQYRSRGILWVLACVIWLIGLVRDLTLYEFAGQVVQTFLSAPRKIGDLSFTYGNVAVFILIIWLSSVVSRVVNFFFGSDVSKTGRRRGIASMMNLVRLIIWTIGFLIAVAATGIPLDKLSLLLGALGVGIGFGLQNIVNNLVSGIILAFERPIRVGDQIEIGNKSGIVKEIGIRSSKIRSSEGADIIVPNGDLISQQLINWTMQDPHKKISFTVEVPYAANLETAREQIMEVMKQNDQIMQTPPPSISIKTFEGNAIALTASFWVPDLSNADSLRTALMTETYASLTKSGIKLEQPNIVLRKEQTTQLPER